MTNEENLRFSKDNCEQKLEWLRIPTAYFAKNRQFCFCYDKSVKKILNCRNFNKYVFIFRNKRVMLNLS